MINKNSKLLKSNTEKKNKMSMLDNQDPVYNVTVDDVRHDSELETPTSVIFDEVTETDNRESRRAKKEKTIGGKIVSGTLNAKQFDATDMMNKAIEDNIDNHDDPYKHIPAVFVDQLKELNATKFNDDKLHAARQAYAKQAENVGYKNLSAESIEHMNLRSKTKQEELNFNPPKTIVDDITSALNNKMREQHNRQMDELIKAATLAASTGYTIGPANDTPQDMINKPDHYHKGGIDVYEIMQAKFSEDVYRGFCLGNVLKYTMRHELKGGVQDLEKAQFNLDRLIESHKGVKYIPTYKKEAK